MSIVVLKLEDNLNFWKMKDYLNFLAKWKTTTIFWQNGRQPQFFSKMEDHLNFDENGRQSQY